MPVATRIPEVLVGNILPFCFGTIILAGRLYARAAILRKIRLDDYLLISGWLAALVNCILAILSTKYGIGMHQVDVPLAWTPVFRKLFFATYILYQLSLGFTKLAIGVLYLHVFSVSSSARRELYVLIAFVFAYTIVLTLQLVLSCVPVRKSWDPDVAGHCFSLVPGFYIHFVCNLASDIWLIFFAASRVWRIKLPTRQRAILLATITLGWVAVVAGIVRVVRIGIVLNAVDRSWSASDPSVWTSVELNVTIICAAVPALKPLFTHLLPDTAVPHSSIYLQRVPSSVPNGTNNDG